MLASRITYIISRMITRSHSVTHIINVTATIHAAVRALRKHASRVSPLSFSLTKIRLLWCDGCWGMIRILRCAVNINDVTF